MEKNVDDSPIVFPDYNVIIITWDDVHIANKNQYYADNGLDT